MNELHSEQGCNSILTVRDDEYRVSSSPESDSDDDNSLNRNSLSNAFRGHPWSDDEEEENESDSLPATRARSKRSRAAVESTGSESTRRSTRRRRQNYSPQVLMDSSDDEEEVTTPSYQFIASVSPVAPDSGSKIERILGRRVLPNTNEADEIMRRNRYAIVSQVLYESTY